MVLGLHYPSDVLAATGIGSLLAAVSLALPAQWLEARPLLKSDLEEEPAAFAPLGLALRLDLR